MIDASFLYWERCLDTGKPEVCPSNLLRLTAYMTGGVVTGAVAGSYVLPLIGIDPSGFVAGGYAAAWQASIGNIVAGSPIAILQSLAATGKAGLLLGGVGSGLGALAALVKADKLDWCTCQYNSGKFDHLLKSKL